MAAKKRKRRTSRKPEKRLLPGASLAIVEAGKGTRFQPGQSGNPDGRPRYAALSAAYRHQLACRLDGETARALKLSHDSTVAEAIAVVLSRCALAGDVNAAREMCNRVEGQAPQFLGIATAARPKTEVTIRVVTDPPKYPLPSREQALMDDLLSMIRTTPDEEIARQIAQLARTLRIKHAAHKP